MHANSLEIGPNGATLKRSEVIRISFTPAEIAILDAVAFAYGMNLPEFGRAALKFVADERPSLAVRLTAKRRPGRPPRRYVLSANGHKVSAEERAALAEMAEWTATREAAHAAGDLEGEIQARNEIGRLTDTIQRLRRDTAEPV